MNFKLSELADRARGAYDPGFSSGWSEHFGSGACQGFIERVAGAVVVCFRGTDQWSDLDEDFEVPQVDVPGIGLVHGGFWRALRDGKDSLWAAWADLSLAQPPLLTTSVYCCGHSLGGALAALFAAELKRDGTKGVCSVGFGMPRVFSKDAAENAAPGLRVIHRFDVVPRIPKWGFKDAGDEILWGASRLSRFLCRGLVRGLMDHRISSYTSYIEEHPNDDRVVCVDARGNFYLAQVA